MTKLLLLAALALAPVSPASAGLKVAVIDLSKVLNSYDKSKEAQAQIKQNMDEAQKELDALLRDYQHQTQEVQKRFDAYADPVLTSQTPQDRAADEFQAQQDLMAMQKKIRETKANSERALQDESGLIHREILDEVSKAVEDYAGSQGFDLVVDKSGVSGNGLVPILVFNSGGVTDITNPIIEKLNAPANPVTAQPNTTANPVIEKSNAPAVPVTAQPGATADPVIEKPNPPIVPVIEQPSAPVSPIIEKSNATAPPAPGTPAVAAPATSTSNSGPPATD